jgi:signal transduction histidine kinase
LAARIDRAPLAPIFASGMGYKQRYALAGALVAAGAPLGFLALRRWCARGAAGRGWLRAELRAQALAYAYLAGGTATVLGLLGLVLGSSRDLLLRRSADVARLREEFASVIAHDLRGPIHALQLQSDLLLEQASEGQVQVPVAVVERLRRVTTNLSRMVDDLLDASRVEAARMTVHRQPLPVDEAAADLVERLRPALAPHPLDIEVRGAPPRVLADRRRFDQVLTNLLENAGKYSAEDQPIHVVVQAAEGGARISVEDHGIGIEPHELPRLFDRFYQAKRARAKKSGLGLGLYVAKGLMEAHRGRIWVDSEAGKGSVFYLWFPAA